MQNFGGIPPFALYIVIFYSILIPIVFAVAFAKEYAKHCGWTISKRAKFLLKVIGVAVIAASGLYKLAHREETLERVRTSRPIDPNDMFMGFAVAFALFLVSLILYRYVAKKRGWS